MTEKTNKQPIVLVNRPEEAWIDYDLKSQMVAADLVREDREPEGGEFDE